MSEVLIISLLVNLSLIILFLIVGIPKLKSYINKYKKRRETRLEKRIHNIVNQYLEQLKND